MVHQLDDAISWPLPSRGVYANRTLNLRSLPAIGFDMDYTLVHYDVVEWERRAYEHVIRRLTLLGWPVEELEFDRSLVQLGLVLDLDLGNLVKTNRFGYAKRACHGTAMLTFPVQREAYGRELIDLSDSRWVFINTLFGVSEACLFAQCVDLLDDGKLPTGISYRELYAVIRSSLDETHMEGTLKQEILADPTRYIVADPDLAMTLLDLKHAGKKLLLITNSEWFYTQRMMALILDPYLPGDMTWRDVFDVSIVSASKPSFFEERRPLFEVVSEDGMLRPAARLEAGKVYLGGHAGLVEQFLDVPGEDILYIGDHIFADVHKSKDILRWRTGLVVRALEAEIEALEAFRPQQLKLSELMHEKSRLEHEFSQLRVQTQRIEHDYGPKPSRTAAEMKAGISKIRHRLVELDKEIATLAKEASELSNKRWGLLMRAGNDKSNLARQVERYADIYTSRVSNLQPYTPFVYLRSPRGSLPHDCGSDGGVDQGVVEGFSGGREIEGA